jgi:chorismate-pyruvate lyase
MTSALERHYGEPLMLRPLWIGRTGGWYVRRVLLALSSSGRPVEMGALAVRLDAIAPSLREQIVRGQIPLGRLLAGESGEYAIQPVAYMRMTPTPAIMGVFWLREPSALYARQTEIRYEEKVIAKVVEMLPPIEAAPG